MGHTMITRAPLPLMFEFVWFRHTMVSSCNSPRNNSFCPSVLIPGPLSSPSHVMCAQDQPDLADALSNKRVQEKLANTLTTVPFSSSRLTAQHPSEDFRSLNLSYHVQKQCTGCRADIIDKIDLLSLSKVICCMHELCLQVNNISRKMRYLIQTPADETTTRLCIWFHDKLVSHNRFSKEIKSTSYG